MRFRSDAQRRAVFAHMGAGGPLAQKFGATRGDRRQLAKRLLLGGLVSGAAGGLWLASKNPMVRKLALSTGIAGIGGAIGTGVTTIRENAEAAARKVGRTGTFLAERGRDTVRNLPVEALTAKAVNRGFGMAESGIHRYVSGHARRLEEIAGSKLGQLQSLATAHAATKARSAHRRFLPQPFSDAHIRELKAWTDIVNPPKLSELTQRRGLRTGYLDRKLDASARRVWNELQKRGHVYRALSGDIDSNVLNDVAQKDGYTESRQLFELANRVRGISFRAGFGHRVVGDD